MSAPDMTSQAPQATPLDSRGRRPRSFKLDSTMLSLHRRITDRALPPMDLKRADLRKADSPALCRTEASTRSPSFSLSVSPIVGGSRILPGGLADVSVETDDRGCWTECSAVDDDLDSTVDQEGEQDHAFRMESSASTPVPPLPSSPEMNTSTMLVTNVHSSEPAKQATIKSSPKHAYVELQEDEEEQEPSGQRQPRYHELGKNKTRMRTLSVDDEDVARFVKRCKDELDRRRTERRATKPILLFVGDSGVGKSSIIRAMFPGLAAEPLDALRISRGGDEGTRGMVVIEGNDVVCLDMPGKSDAESAERYVEQVSLELRRLEHARRTRSLLQLKRVAFVVGVLGWREDRDDDIGALRVSIQAISRVVNAPFIILQNQTDRSTPSFGDDVVQADGESLEERLPERVQQRLLCARDLFALIKRAPPSGLNVRIPRRKAEEPLFRGVFAVAAAPSTLRTRCPADRAPPRSREAHRPFMECSHQVRLCHECGTITYNSRYEDDPRVGREIANLQQENPDYRIVLEAALPVNLGRRDAPMSALMGSIDAEAMEVMARAFSKSSSERLWLARFIIDQAISAITTRKEAAKADERLCHDLAVLFNVPRTGKGQSKLEFGRWRKQSDFAALFERWSARWISSKLKRRLRLYVASWGIFYARRYLDMHRGLFEASLVSISEEGIEEEAQVSEVRTELQRMVDFYLEGSAVKAIFDMACERDLEDTYDQYLLCKKPLVFMKRTSLESDDGHPTPSEEKEIIIDAEENDDLRKGNCDGHVGQRSIEDDDTSESARRVHSGTHPRFYCVKL